jgi:hypothetical protein
MRPMHVQHSLGKIWDARADPNIVGETGKHDKFLACAESAEKAHDLGSAPSQFSGHGLDAPMAGIPG